MTVIVWDGTTLAADKRATCGDVKSTVTKIFRHNSELLGVTGDLSMGLELLDWYTSGAVPKDWPAGNRGPDSGACLIVIKEDATVWKYESGPFAWLCEGKYHAWGSGALGALVALECGKKAKGAVFTTCQFTNSCGNGIDALSLKGREDTGLE